MSVPAYQRTRDGRHCPVQTRPDAAANQQREAARPDEGSAKPIVERAIEEITAPQCNHSHLRVALCLHNLHISQTRCSSRLDADAPWPTATPAPERTPSQPPHSPPPSHRPSCCQPQRVAGKSIMNGTDIKKAAINKAKQVAQAANGNGGKKRRKGQDLKPIITNEQQAQNPGSASFHYKYVFCSSPSPPSARARPKLAFTHPNSAPHPDPFLGPHLLLFCCSCARTHTHFLANTHTPV